MTNIETTNRKLELIQAINEAYRKLSVRGEYWRTTHADTYKAIERISKPLNADILETIVYDLEMILKSAQQLLQVDELLFKQPKQFRFFYVMGDYDYMSDDYPDLADIMNWAVIPYSAELCEKWIDCKDHTSILANMYAVNEDSSLQDFQYFSSEAEARLAIYYELCQSHYEYTHDI